MFKNLFVVLFVLLCCDVMAASPRVGRNVVVNNVLGASNVGVQRSGISVKSPASDLYNPQVVSSQNVAVAPEVVAESVVIMPETVLENVDEVEVVQKTMQQIQAEKQRDICMRNNIGIGNTFVWAARNSNVDNYSMMIEDINVPENNACFVKVAINSTDSRIKVSDLPTKYFEMGRVVECGSWVDEDMLEKRILDAKKSARTWGVVASTVGSAAVGVGAMELFGNKLIGGAVQGQKALEGQDLILSQLKVLKKDNQTEYNRVVAALRDLEEYCDKPGLWDGTEKPRDCDNANNPFMGLLDRLN